MEPILPPVYSLNPSNAYDLESASVDFLTTIFSKVFKEMYESAQTSSLLPKTPAEKWFREMLIEEYTRAICKRNLKPLVKQVENALMTAKREVTSTGRRQPPRGHRTVKLESVRRHP